MANTTIDQFLTGFMADLSTGPAGTPRDAILLNDGRVAVFWQDPDVAGGALRHRLFDLEGTAVTAETVTIATPTAGTDKILISAQMYTGGFRVVWENAPDSGLSMAYRDFDATGAQVEIDYEAISPLLTADVVDKALNDYFSASAERLNEKAPPEGTSGDVLFSESTDFVFLPNGVRVPAADVLFGTSGSDTVEGSSMGDDLVGLAGNDRMAGGASADDVFGGSGQDSLSGGSGDDMLSGGADGDRITGGSGRDEIFGGAGRDSLSGGAGDDMIVSGAGSDLMTGGTGADMFVFNVAAGASNRDTITDFDTRADVIGFDNAVFRGLAEGDLAASAFVRNTSGNAADASDRVIYESDTGKLWFDRDGNGAAAKIHVATLDAGLSVTHDDFFVI